MNWYVWRVATSQIIPDGYTDIRDNWTLAELQEAHAVLDAIELAHERAQRRADGKSSGKRTILFR